MTTTNENQKLNLRDVATRTDMYRIDPRVIEIEENHNPRDYNLPENRAHLDELKKSIAVRGVQVPLEVRQDKVTGRIFVVDGECRLRATMELIKEGREDIKTVPAIIVPAGSEKERLFKALIANTGKPLSTWESGKAFEKLVRFGETPESISEQLGYSLRFVNEALELADAPEAVQHLLSEQAVTPSLALHELRTKPVPEAIESLKKQVSEARAKGQKTARKTQENRTPTTEKLLKVIGEVIESIDDDIFDTSEGRFSEVGKIELRKLAALVGITKKKDKEKAA